MSTNTKNWIPEKFYDKPRGMTGWDTVYKNTRPSSSVTILNMYNNFQCSAICAMYCHVFMSCLLNKLIKAAGLGCCPFDSYSHSFWEMGAFHVKGKKPKQHIVPYMSTYEILFRAHYKTMFTWLFIRSNTWVGWTQIWAAPLAGELPHCYLLPKQASATSQIQVQCGEGLVCVMWIWSNGNLPSCLCLAVCSFDATLNSNLLFCYFRQWTHRFTNAQPNLLSLPPDWWLRCT